MGLGDRIRGFFSKRGNPALEELEAWAADRKGIEGYIEPQTATSPTTLLLVDRSGEHIRGPVKDPRDAAAFCERIGVPVYDAQVMGYPQRMKDFEKRRRTINSDDLDKDIEELEKRLTESDPPS
ncbi:MAG: hypothetical protein QOG54_1164 [Actinomycetota bacterium]|jgi:hypothetical protein|nr:hypothetical protein [Actinomycetota bacterium]